MDSLRLSEEDIIHHVVRCGVDIFPTVEIPKERTRLNIFFEEARTRHPKLCEQLIASDKEFRISREFKPSGASGGPGMRVDTFALTARGPVFIIPVRLPDPIGPTGLEGEIMEYFKALRQLFFSAIAERKLMRIGLVRDLMFDTGQAACEGVLSEKSEFAGAQLKGGKCGLVYRDEICNVRIEFEPADVMKTTKLPVGTEVTERQSYGLHVVLDVNNHQLRPLEDADIERVMERATSLWPKPLLEWF